MNSSVSRIVKWWLKNVILIACVLTGSLCYGFYDGNGEPPRKTTVLISNDRDAPATFVQVPAGIKLSLTSVNVVPDPSDENHVKTRGSTVLTINLEDGRQIIINGVDFDLRRQEVKWTAEQADDIRKHVLAMASEDQSVREKILKLEKDSHQKVAALELMHKVDRKNQIDFSEIITRYGWPTLSMVGEDGSRAAFLILQHANKEFRAKYLPLARKAAEAGEIRPDLLATLEDRQLVESGKAQLYGTQFLGGIDEKKGPLAPVQNPEGLEERRRRAGF